MTSAADRREILALIEAAVTDGARRATARAELGLHPRTLGRWQDPEGSFREDRRPFAECPVPANRLSKAERARYFESFSAIYRLHTADAARAVRPSLSVI